MRNYHTVQTELILACALAMALLVLFGTFLYTGAAEYDLGGYGDFTNSAVGCVDDCLEPITIVKGN